MKEYILTLTEKDDDLITWAAVETNAGRDDVLARALQLYIHALKADKIITIKDGNETIVKVK